MGPVDGGGLGPETDPPEKRPEVVVEKVYAVDQQMKLQLETAQKKVNYYRERMRSLSKVEGHHFLYDQVRATAVKVLQEEPHE